MVKCLVIAMLMILSISSFAQTSEPFCGTDAIYQNNPVLKQELSNKTLALRNANIGAVDPNTVFTLPVVFVVYHLGEAVGTGSNLSDAKLNDELAKLNDAFRARGTFAGLNDSKIQFERAKFDANCGAASGIVRVNASSVAGYAANGLDYGDNTTHQALRTLHNWNNRDEYITIELVHKLNGASGYAGYLAGYLVIDASSYWWGLTAHEMGHCLNLRHTFEGDNGGSQCPPNANPETEGDMISDTDPHKTGDNCFAYSETSINSCSGVPFGKLLSNFMAYSGPCWDRFTPKQIERMRNSLVNFKPQWINSQALTGQTSPPLANGGERCGSGTVTLSASGCSGIYNWYANPTGGNSLSTSVTFNTPNLNATTIYYVSCKKNTCLESTRAAATAMINPSLIQKSACTLTATNGTGIYYGISSFSFNTIARTNGQTSAVTGSNYTGFDCTYSTTVQAGSSYSFTINSVSGNSVKAKIFIDYNNNGVLDDAGEIVYNSSSFFATHTGTITIPVNTITNIGLRMRVMIDPVDITSCNLQGSSMYGSGKAEDYAVVISPTSCTAPSSPTAIPGSRCGSGTVSLSASSCAGTYNWYGASSGGNSLGTSSSFTTPSITTTTPYYVSCTVGNCTSARTSVVATIYDIPSAPTISAVTINSGQTATLTANNCSGIANWYSAATGSNFITSGNTYTTPTLTITTTYYAACTVGVCQSATRSSGTVTVNPTTNPCPPTITHTTGLLPAGTYQASQIINSPANISSPTTFIAGQSILLTNGFSAGPNETFLAKIEGCTTAPTNGLVAYYPFNGNANDESGNNYHGIIDGATLATDRKSVTNKAYSFNGTNGRIRVEDTPNLDFSSSFSVSFWAKINVWGNGTSAGILSKKVNDVGNGYVIYNDGTYPSKMNFRLKGSSGTQNLMYSETAVSIGGWEYWAMSYNSTTGTTKLYKNGVLDKSHPSGNVGNMSNDAPLYFGYSQTWNGYLNGSLDEIRIYNRAITDAEVLQIYNAEKP